MTTVVSPLGTPLSRVEGREKVTGQAKYAYEFAPEGVAYAVIVQSTVAKGEITEIEVPALDGLLAVITHQSAPTLEEVPDGELAVLQSARVAYRGQPVAVVVAEAFEVARDAAAQVRIAYATEPHDVRLRPDHPASTSPTGSTAATRPTR
jgi:xanthine dehydrogenase YagR molybdenum-binding subunit